MRAIAVCYYVFMLDVRVQCKFGVVLAVIVFEFSGLSQLLKNMLWLLIYGTRYSQTVPFEYLPCLVP